MTLEFTEGAATRTTVDGFAAAVVRVVTPEVIGIVSELYRCAPADPLLDANPSLPARPLEVPRVLLAGSADVIVRDIDLIRGDILLSTFSFKKPSERGLR